MLKTEIPNRCFTTQTREALKGEREERQDWDYESYLYVKNGHPSNMALHELLSS